MAGSNVTTVDEYLSELPEDRRQVISTVREAILRHLPAGYEETMNWGMISYEIPLARYADTHNRRPLSYVALAAQKHYYSLYLMGVYQDSEQERSLQEGFQAAGKRLDMGKSCVRFRKLEDLPLDVIGDVIAAVSPEAFIARYKQAHKK